MEMVLEMVLLNAREGRQEKQRRRLPLYRRLELQQPSLVRLIRIKTPQGLQERTRGAVTVKWNRATYGYSKGNL